MLIVQISQHMQVSIRQFLCATTLMWNQCHIDWEWRCYSACSYPGLHADHTLRDPRSLHWARGWGGDGAPRGEGGAGKLEGGGGGKRRRRTREWSCGGDLFLFLLQLDSLTSSCRRRADIKQTLIDFHWVSMSHTHTFYTATDSLALMHISQRYWSDYYFVLIVVLLFIS